MANTTIAASNIITPRSNDDPDFSSLPEGLGVGVLGTVSVGAGVVLGTDGLGEGLDEEPPPLPEPEPPPPPPLPPPPPPSV